MTRPTPASMPAVDRIAARADRRQNLDDLIAETHYVFDVFVERGFNADDALTLTDITLNRKDPHV